MRQVLLSYQRALAVRYTEGAPTLEQAILWETCLDLGIRIRPSVWSGFVWPTGEGYLVTVETGWTEEEEKELEELEELVAASMEKTCPRECESTAQPSWVERLRGLLRRILG